MRVLIATDAFAPQVNGVVRSYDALSATAASRGAECVFLGPHGFQRIPLPSYKEIRLAVTGLAGVARRIAELEIAGGPFDHIHVATEGPIGFATRRYCLRKALPFTTSYHTRFPEYIAARFPVPEALSYAVLRRFHNAGNGTMVATPSLANELAARGFDRIMPWSRGVDHALFNPGRRVAWDLPRPVFLYAGRLAPEKNIEAFLSLTLPGSKVVAGDGPAASALKAAFPQTVFLGMRKGEDLARIYASSDVFVFPSRTDTFGIVLLEAMASGLPVAALPVPGPIDVVADSGAGSLSDDLQSACLRALTIPRVMASARAAEFTWKAATDQFFANIAEAQAQHGAGRDRRLGEDRELFAQRQAVES